MPLFSTCLLGTVIQVTLANFRHCRGKYVLSLRSCSCSSKMIAPQFVLNHVYLPCRTRLSTYPSTRLAPQTPSVPRDATVCSSQHAIFAVRCAAQASALSTLGNFKYVHSDDMAIEYSCTADPF